MGVQRIDWEWPSRRCPDKSRTWRKRSKDAVKLLKLRHARQGEPQHKEPPPISDDR